MDQYFCTHKFGFFVLKCCLTGGVPYEFCVFFYEVMQQVKCGWHVRNEFVIINHHDCVHLICTFRSWDLFNGFAFIFRRMRVNFMTQITYGFCKELTFIFVQMEILTPKSFWPRRRWNNCYRVSPWTMVIEKAGHSG
jgi:hypothetical protein